MIGSIKGEIVLKNENFLIVETGGVGYKINTPPEDLSNVQKVGDTIFLWIHTHIREDAMDLYGFMDYKELKFFEMLISVPSIGPRSGLAILGIASIETLQKAIFTNDTAYLTKISGIGRKTAEKIVLELRDKVEGEDTGSSLQVELDALEALKSLGYSQIQARDALKKVSVDADTSTKVREALKILGSK